jgi:phosphoribosylformimino-5-aminoimidazole carboxamide ribotide isomerase
MKIIPAIDIKNGQCVRLREGRFDDSEIYSDNPVEVALGWVTKGAQYLHVVDLDGARLGQLTNTPIIEKIIQEAGIPVQVGGGIRSQEEVQMLVDLGVDRMILGTILWEDKTLAKSLFDKFPDKIIAGVDARNGYVAIEGWQNVTSVSAFEFAAEMEGLGARRIVYTDIKRDGMMMGPNIANIEKMLNHLNISLIAAGGITSNKDIINLKKFQKKGLEAIIVGKALYKKSILLEEAIKLLENKEK